MKTKIEEFSHRNHSVPQAYFRGWSTDGTRVWARRLLVPSPQYPEWTRTSIRSLARYDHLYTSVRSGEESDAFERWLNEEFEDPAAEPLRRVRADHPITADDLRRLAYYAAALDQRTPVSYMEQSERMMRDMPGILQSTLAGVKRKLRKADKERRRIEPSREVDNNSLPLRVRVEDSPRPGMATLKVEISVGRELWLHNMRHTLTKTIAVLKDHDWTILKPYEGYHWFTSDHPVLKLNFWDANKYNFGGGWGNRGSEIILPISPTHLLYTKVGHPKPKSQSFDMEQTSLLQKFLAERAHRWIVAMNQPLRAVWFRRRVVDQTRFEEEETQWAEWERAQADAESGTPRRAD